MLAEGFEDISRKVDITRDNLNRAIAKQDCELMLAYGKELVELLDVKDMYRTAVLREKQKKKELKAAERKETHVMDIIVQQLRGLSVFSVPEESKQGLVKMKIS